MSEKKVIVYTQPGCSACSNAKSYLTQKGITFEEKNVRQDQTALEELTQDYRSNSTPTILIDGEVIIGFDRERLEQLLA
jgi:Glutaredoxin-like protein, YruB-family